MNFILDIKLLLLLSVANGAPVIVQNILGPRWVHPLDGGLLLPDGQPLLGASKTIRGLLFSLLATTLIGSTIGIGWEIALLLAATAMAGDLASSFVKRRLRLPPSSMAIGVDQIPESLLPLLVCADTLALTVFDIIALVACFFAGEILLSRLLYHLHLRNRPY
jgi:CDP-2,3-bis-(O-geranylgeranyl)-sn-glycerol synthase